MKERSLKSQPFLSLMRAVKQNKNREQSLLGERRGERSVVVEITVGMRTQKSRMTRILQRRITAWGGGKNRETVEAEKWGHEEGSQQ